MKSSEFCSWLNDMFQAINPATLDTQQIQLIKTHLDMVTEDNPLPFCSFLKGYFTISKPEQIGLEETQLIRDYLANALRPEVELENPDSKPIPFFQYPGKMRC